ncbi:YhcN/YlaJ family sporulation lipoprotein [Paenibacillus sp. MSJ-34]|uniref:YhcN/YlaJ family sporulation lipoprotein n=2 Tax=unclassified Paenibacillus TaxID=185978 RepID=UPI001EF9C900|nr:YhcN/YlaJ family sporulation lipoprotein [Paenibacillus sp. MSJ-34]CAH0119584.1 hypothetical protein PAE9249_02088 [Paenibacillus sp. CECT 9249]
MTMISWKLKGRVEMRTWLSIVALMLLLTSCNQVRNNTSPSPQGMGPQTQSARTYNTGNNNAIYDANAVKQHLERLATSIPGVRGANCVILGNTAVVGIDVNEKMERSRVGTIKYSVAEAFRKDPYGMNAVVTADVDLRERIREVGLDIQNGKPIAGILNELADIVGRIVPQMPKDTVPVRENPDRKPVDEPKLNRHL